VGDAELSCTAGVGVGVGTPAIGRSLGTTRTGFFWLQPEITTIAEARNSKIVFRRSGIMLY
jgi:hypothetical protein